METCPVEVDLSPECSYQLPKELEEYNMSIYFQELCELGLEPKRSNWIPVSTILCTQLCLFWVQLDNLYHNYLFYRNLCAPECCPICHYWNSCFTRQWHLSLPHLKLRIYLCNLNSQGEWNMDTQTQINSHLSSIKELLGSFIESHFLLVANS